MKRIAGVIAAATVALAGCANKTDNKTTDMNDTAQHADTSVVYMTKEISPEAIVKLYKALGREAKGKVAIKISTGEPGGHNFLQPSLIADFVKLTDGTIVECNTAYEGAVSRPKTIAEPPKSMGSPPLLRSTSWMPTAR